MGKIINNEVWPRRNEFGDKLCACCGNFWISDDDEIAAQELCDRCHAEINAPDDIVGWRKGE